MSCQFCEQTRELIPSKTVRDMLEKLANKLKANNG